MGPKKQKVVNIPQGARMERGACGETYIIKDGKKVIPESVRADGSIRKAVPIKPGYIPAEEAQKYKGAKGSASEAYSRLKGTSHLNFAPSMDPTAPMLSRMNQTPDFPAKKPPGSTMRSGWVSSSDSETGECEGVSDDSKGMSLSEIKKREREEKEAYEAAHKEEERVREEQRLKEEEERKAAEALKKPPVVVKTKAEQTQDRINLIESKLVTIKTIEQRKASGVRLNGKDIETLKRKPKLDAELKQLKTNIVGLTKEDAFDEYEKTRTPLQQAVKTLNRFEKETQ